MTTGAVTSASRHADLTLDASQCEKYCLFRVGHSVLAVLAARVREVGLRPTITPVPHTDSLLAGVAHIRNEFLPILNSNCDSEEFCQVLFRCCLQHAVGNRPDRYEPRVVKRRAKPYKLMTKPRQQYKPGEAP